MKKGKSNSESDILRRKAEELLKNGTRTTAPPVSEIEMLKLIYDLEVHQVELEMQNEELRHAWAMAEVATNKYTDLYEFAPSGYFTMTEEGLIIALNLTGAALIGKPSQQIKNHHFTLLLCDQSKPVFRLFLEKVFQSKSKETCEVKLLGNDDIPLVVLLTGIMAENQEQCSIAMVDITERKRTEELLRESETRFRYLSDSAPVLIWMSGTDALCNYFNQPWLDFTGRTLEQELGNGWAEGVHADDLQNCLDIYLSAFKAQREFSMEYRLRRADGEYRWVLDNGVPRFTPERLFIGYIGSLIDITERKLVENTQRFLLGCGLPGTGEDFFDSLARYLSQTLNMEYVCIDRLEGDGLTAQTVSIYNEGRFETNVLYALKDTPCGEVVDRNVCYYRRGVQQLFPNDAALQDLNAESYVGTTLIDSKGKAIGLIAIIGQQPLHEEGRGKELLKLVAPRAAGELERREAESEIRHLNETLEHRIADRTSQYEALNKELTFHLSELEQFTYVSNHDLQEPLRTLIQFTQLFNEKYAGTLDEDGNKYIEFIGKSAGRMSALVKNLLEYSLLGKESVKSCVDCNTAVDSVLTDLSDAIIASNAKITIHQLPVVTGYETELRLLFQNLIGNAIKYQKPGNVPEVIVSAGSNETEWIFSITDNGIGIDQKYYEKIFIIFQRLHNRSEYEGTGIGLAHCKKIAEIHGGRIWVESIPGEGSAFIFSIPK